MKGLKITNYILLSLSIIAQFFAIYFIIPTISLIINGKGLEGLAIIAILPLFFICCFLVFVFAIILSITAKKLKNKLIENQQTPNFFDKFMGYIGWIFLLIDICFFISLYIF